MKHKLFITGMGGMAGQVLVKFALERGYQVAGTVNTTFPQEFQKLVNQKLLNCYSVNLKDSAKTCTTIKDFNPDFVIHLAGKVLGGLDKKVFDYSIYEENILIFENVLKGIKMLKKSPRFILSSGCLIYNKQTSPNLVMETPVEDLPQIDPYKEPYRASKADQEKILEKDRNIDYVIVRPTQFTGPGKIPGVIEWYIASEISKILSGEKKKITVKNKLGEVDILDVRDVARAYLLLLEKGSTGNIYHISSGSPVTVERLAKVFLKVVKLPPKYPVESTDVEKKVYFRFSSSKLNDLGWKPQFSLKETLTSYWQYFKNQ